MLLWVSRQTCPRHHSRSTTTLLFTRRPLGVWSHVKQFWDTIVGEDPRAEREWQDSGMALVALNHRRLRLQNPGTNPNDLIDPAYKDLEKKFMDLNNIGLRYELNDALTPLLLEVLENFQHVDDRLGSAEPPIMPDGLIHKILLDEYARTLRQLADLENSPTLKTYSVNRPSPALFLGRKSGALSTLLSHFRWSKAVNDQQALPPARDSTSLETENTIDTQTDDFGYKASDDTEDVVDAMRHHQAINLVRSAMLRQELGHSVIALKSTLPGAGRGIFVDGSAMAGSLLAFMPGEVWPKEHLLDMTETRRAHFANDDNFQLTMRSDETLIDSRRSPYTVLTNDGSNPWAVAHIVNHPPKGAMPNCRWVMINFTGPMKLDKSGLMRYVPNTYAKQPMLLGAKAMDRDDIVMLGLGLQAVRDVSNEELFLNYRLSGSKDGQPPWYHEINPEGAAESFQKEHIDI